jgi:hypothetical protein
MTSNRSLRPLPSRPPLPATTSCECACARSRFSRAPKPPMLSDGQRPLPPSAQWR